jgi:hypothetical protein
VTFLLRSPTIFDDDNTIQKYVASGTARFVKGDALNEEDCRKGWIEASKEAPVDYCIFSVGMQFILLSFSFSYIGLCLGGTPSFSLSPLGFVISPFDLCARSYRNVVSTIPEGLMPNIVCVSGAGIGKKSKAALPWLVKPVFALINQPAADKCAMERVAYHIGGMSWDEMDLGQPKEALMGARDWVSRPGLPANGSFKGKIVIVRAALLTDGECRADKDRHAYRTSHEEFSTMSISRKDVGHFVAQLCTESWDKWVGTTVKVGY